MGQRVGAGEVDRDSGMQRSDEICRGTGLEDCDPGQIPRDARGLLAGGRRGRGGGVGRKMQRHPESERHRTQEDLGMGRRDQGWVSLWMHLVEVPHP